MHYTVVIDAKKIFKRFMFGLAVATICLGLVIGSNFYSQINLKTYAKSALVATLGFDLFDMKTIIYKEIPLLKNINASSITVANVQNADKLPPKNARENNLVGISSKINPIEEIHIYNDFKPIQGISINNESNFDINIQSLLNAKLPFSVQKGPQVLILHTHTTEAYTPLGQTTYTDDEVERTTDANLNVVRVGKEIAEVFRSFGINVIHDSKIHDEPSFNGSYKAALATIEKYKKKYSSIQIVLDVHRDSMVTADMRKLKVCANCKDETVAQLMFVVGTNQNLHHPDWIKNFTFAVKLQNKILTQYPGLMRPINVRKERFNQHVAPGSLIIEVGTSGNTLDEAILGARYAAKSMAEFILTMK